MSDAPKSHRFGSHLRAARLGYHWCEPARAYVRVSGPSEKSPGPWRVDVAQRTEDMFDVKKKEQHRVWWEDDPKGERLWALCHALRMNLASPGSFWATEEGYCVLPPAPPRNQETP